MTRCESYPPCFGTIYFPTAAFFDTKYKYKFTIFTDCIERKYGKDWLL